MDKQVTAGPYKKKILSNRKEANADVQNREEMHRYHTERRKLDTRHAAWFPDLQWQEADSGDLAQEWTEQLPKAEEGNGEIYTMVWCWGCHLRVNYILIKIYFQRKKKEFKNSHNPTNLKNVPAPKFWLHRPPLGPGNIFNKCTNILMLVVVTSPPPLHGQPGVG